MIRNERQYRVTLAQRARLAAQLDAQPPADVPEWVIASSRAAVESQLLDMDNELSEYTSLRDGTSGATSEVSNLSDLPRALIRARIAANMTQRDLADRLSLKEQQIQKYESTDYGGASVSRLQEVMAALGVTFRGAVALPSPTGDAAVVRKRLLELGLNSEVVTRRFFAGSGGASNADTIGAAARAARIFGLDDGAIESARPQLARAASFRAPASATREGVSGYSQYAEYLTGLLVQACTTTYRPLPSVDDLRERYDDELRRAPLQTLLVVCWDHGIPVLPLADSGTFHGACWWFDGRPAIALKHGVRSPERWAFLLGHEMEHARADTNVNVLEEDLPVRAWREQPGERAADASASRLLLGDRAEAMALVAVRQAHNDVANLKAIVPAVAEAGRVSAGVFADYVATRVNTPSINWWPTANNLHTKDLDAWRMTRSVLFDHADFLRLDELDREILIDGIGL